MEELRKDIKETSDRGKTINDLVALVGHYNQELSRILDKHAPEKNGKLSSGNLLHGHQKTSSLKNEKDKGLRENAEKRDYLLMKMDLKDKRTELMLY